MEKHTGEENLSSIYPDANSVSAEPNHTLLTLLPKQTFHQYREDVFGYLSTTSSSSAKALVKKLLAFRNAFEPLALLTALEAAKSRLKIYDQQIQSLQGVVILHADLKNRLSKKLNIDAINLLEQLKLYLKETINTLSSTSTNSNGSHSARLTVLKTARDQCLLILTKLLTKQLQGDEWNAGSFVKKINEQQVYQVTKLALYTSQFDKKLLKLKSATQFFKKNLKTLFLTNIVNADLKLLIEEKKVYAKHYHLLIKAIKDQLNVATDWKTNILGYEAKGVHKFGGKKGTTLMLHEIDGLLYEPERFVPSETQATSAAMGSTFFFKQPSTIPIFSLVLDANYVCGDAGATSDGYGHFNNASVNKAIQETAHLATKYSVRLLNKFTNPFLLFSSMGAVIKTTALAMQFSLFQMEEIGTASCVVSKTFKDKDKAHFILVAGGIGDSMIIAWEPATKKIQTLIKPQHYQRGSYYSPLSITEKLSDHLIQKTLQKLPIGSVVFRLTDGAWEGLPFVEKTGLFDDKLQRAYREYEIDTGLLLPLLEELVNKNKSVSAQDYRLFFQQLIKENIRLQHRALKQAKSLVEKLMSELPVTSTLDWLKTHQVKNFKALEESLQPLHQKLTLHMTLTLTEFLQQLEAINIGDDVTLHVDHLTNTDAGQSTMNKIFTPH